MSYWIEQQVGGANHAPDHHRGPRPSTATATPATYCVGRATCCVAFAIFFCGFFEATVFAADFLAAPHLFLVAAIIRFIPS